MNNSTTRDAIRSRWPHVRFKPFGKTRDVYAAPLVVTDINDCYFYHSMDIPGHGTVHGEWDLRGHESEYLGGVDVRGKRVLEMGTASGALGFWMESQGAELVGYDLSPALDWDIVPYTRAEAEYQATVTTRKNHIPKLNNGWWLAHRAFGSRARAVYGDVYHVPAEIGPVDVVTYGAILLHLRDPFLALWNGLRLARETAVVTDLVLPGSDLDAPTLRFAPDFTRSQPQESWWFLSPNLIVQMLGVLGFEDARLSYHPQKFAHGPMNLFTVVARRTQGTVRP